MKRKDRKRERGGKEGRYRGVGRERMGVKEQKGG